MKILKAIGISNGFALAKLYFKKSAKSISENFTSEENEWKRFKSAQKSAIIELGDLAKAAKETQGEDISLLFETHQLMAEDPDFEDCVEAKIKTEHIPAARAVAEASEVLEKILTDSGDDYMKSRASDIKDVSKRISNIINNVSNAPLTFNEPVIIAADDLSPSETLRLDTNFVKGFILFNGTKNGHTGILARNMGIPAVIKPTEPILESDAGKTVFLDGFAGTLTVEPEGSDLDECTKKISEYQKHLAELEKYKSGPTVTSKGQKIKLYCNIGNCEDVAAVIENGGEGIGLFRSEFLYLKNNDYPSEEEQFNAYKTVLEAMNKKEVIIRTLDIGSDKKADYLNLPDEENPALGTRAIRLCLSRKEMFKEQLRALYRASAFGNLSIMLPMIASVWEIKETKDIIREVKAELTEKNISFSENVRVGIMIETPAAVVISDELAKEADFFSIGTNDLTQYTLACDRNSDLGRYFDPHHPAILRMIKTVSQNAKAENIDVGICGELGADETLTEFFLEAGIDELSVSPKKIPSLRKRISEL